MRRLMPALICILLLATACTDYAAHSDKSVSDGKDSLSDLLAYKNSPHQIFLGYLVGDGNDPVAAYNPANAPDSVDYLEFFAGRDTVRAHWREAQAKGTKLIVSHFVSEVYFDGSAKDPATKVPGYVNPKGFNQHHPTLTSSYNHWARDMYKQEIEADSLDGIDLDIEIETFGEDVLRNAANGDSLVVAIARYYGPNCTECKVMSSAGRKPAFFYDTDGSCGLDSIMYGRHKSNYDYVLFQSYTTGGHNWKGTDTTDFAPLVAMYDADKIVFMVNGDSFLYPDGTQDKPCGDSIATASLYKYARYVKNNHCAGTGVYRMSRDYNHKPPFAVSRKAMRIMNP